MRWFRAFRSRVPGGLVAAAFLACAGPSGGPGGGDGRAGLRFVFVTHGQASDPFWSVVSNGARAAARDLGVRVEYQAPVRFDMIEMSQLIEAALASRPDGMVVSIPDGPALGEAIRAVVRAGIPVVSINSGDAVAAQLGTLLHIGQPEYDAGFGAGARLRDAGSRVALCVNHEVGNAALDQRCDGFRDAFARDGRTVRVLAVDLADPDDAEQRMRGALAADASVDAILTLGPTAIAPALAAIAAAPSAGGIRYATFDLTPDALDALEAGRLEFAIDQQPYLQGYLPIVLLVNRIETRTLPAGRIMPTGPAFVTRADVAAVRELTARGIR